MQLRKRGVAVGGRVHVVFGERQRFREQFADTRFVVDHEDPALPDLLRADWFRTHCPGWRRALAIEPRVDIALSEPPLPANAHCGNLSGLDQAVDSAQIDLEVFEHLFGREEDFVVLKMEWQNSSAL